MSRTAASSASALKTPLPSILSAAAKRLFTAANGQMLLYVEAMMRVAVRIRARTGGRRMRVEPQIASAERNHRGGDRGGTAAAIAELNRHY